VWMTISIVVPTRDRPQSLSRCLAALGAQDADAAEVVVVDDGSRDRDALAGALAAAPVEARLIRTGGAGPAAARNVGARAATGELICFTDDDCEPQPDWARLLTDAAARAGAAGGKTVVPPGATAAVVASQAITEHLTMASLDASSGRLGFAPTCNLAVVRDALSRVPFDESFPSAAGEDRDWSARAVAAGVAPEFVRDAVVVHHQALSAGGFIRQQFRYGQGAARFRGSDRSRRLAPPGFYTGLVRRGFAAGPLAGGLVVAAQAATAAGIASERLRSART
jgi:GT2 family glycosyltransferase